MRRSTFSHRTSKGREDANGRQLVACLAGDGVGPELMAEATRALARVSKLHSLPLDELHLPFAGEAVTRYGHALPLSTRAAYLKADAILVATPHEPAVEAIKADLDLVWRVTHVHVPTPRRRARLRRRLVRAARAGDRAGVLQRRVQAGSRHGRRLHAGLARAPSRRSVRGGTGSIVEHRTLGETLVHLREAHDDVEVIVTEAELVEPLTDAIAHLAGSPATVAHAWLAEDGPGLFAPGASDPADLAGFGVADPTAMLLTVSLLLAEGLQRRSGARTLERAVAAAPSSPPRHAHVHRRRARAAPGEARPTSSCSRRRGRDANARLRRDSALARGRGRRRRVRDSGRRDPADVRRDRARDDRPPRPRPARAGRGPHGRGLRARVRQGRRRDRDLRPGRHEPRDADRGRVDGLDAARLHHRPGAREPDRHRRLPGDRRDGHHDADRQALVARAGRARSCRR